MKRRNPFSFSSEGVDEVLGKLISLTNKKTLSIRSFEYSYRSTKSTIVSKRLKRGRLLYDYLFSKRVKRSEEIPFIFSPENVNEFPRKLISLTNKEARKDSNVERQRNHPPLIYYSVQSFAPILQPSATTTCPLFLPSFLHFRKDERRNEKD